MIKSLQLSPNAFSFPVKPYRTYSYSTSPSAALDAGVKILTEANQHNLQLESTKGRIRKLFDDVQLSVSSYDTAWVALVPSPTSSRTPCFPECIDWLLDNQHSDGSWGLPHNRRYLVKDALSSTLASILALKRWGIGKDHIDKGLNFIESNSSSVDDGDQHSPIGFHIIFPGLIKYAEDFNLKVPFESSMLDTMFRRRELELRRYQSEGRKSYLAYISEGVGKSQDWDMVMKYQRKNGSLFNSPSSTAAAYMHLKDARCLSYLNSLLAKFGNAVPTVYPLEIYLRLCVVDVLEKLGIERHFMDEINIVLDETYRGKRLWLQKEEEIFLDSTTCAMAFRLLRLNSYDVSSEHIMQITEEELELGPYGGHTALELYRASELILHQVESSLENQNSICGQLLKQKIYNNAEYDDRLDTCISQEIEDIKFPFYATLDRTASRRSIEHYDVNSIGLMKTSYCSPNIGNKDILKLAVEDFNACQSIHREELKSLERWVVDQRLDELKFARQKVLYCFYGASATFFAPELCDARMSWTKFAVLTTVIDDFFDDGGSMEELENLVKLYQKWDNVNVNVDCCSDEVEILFSAVHCTICDLGAKAIVIQGRHVTSHLIEMWMDMVNSMLREAKWAKDKTVPTIDEYMGNGGVSFALGPVVLPALYFIGPKLHEEVVSSSEYLKLFELMSNIGRLLNDIQSFKRETEAGQLNALSLIIIHGNKSKDEAAKEIKDFVASQRRELLNIVMKKNSAVPQACKELFWKMSKVLHFFYKEDDAYTSNDMMDTVKALIYEPISLSE